MIERICPICGTVYNADLWRLKQGRQTTCSRKCSYALRVQERTTSIEVPCERCGKAFKTTPYKLSIGRGRYCSLKCFHPPVIKECASCGKSFRISPSHDASNYCSRKCAYASESRAQKLSIATTKMWSDPEARAARLQAIKIRSQSTAWKSAPHFQRGVMHPRYKGNKQLRADRSRYEYKHWRDSVFKRDAYTCQQCGQKGHELNAHHIKPWAEYPESRYDIENGITLCEICHAGVHGKIFRPKTYKCQRCGKPKKSGRRPHCKSCGAFLGNINKKK